MSKATEGDRGDKKATTRRQRGDNWGRQKSYTQVFHRVVKNVKCNDLWLLYNIEISFPQKKGSTTVLNTKETKEYGNENLKIRIRRRCVEGIVEGVRI